MAVLTGTRVGSGCNVLYPVQTALPIVPAEPVVRAGGSNTALVSVTRT